MAIVRSGNRPTHLAKDGNLIFNFAADWRLLGTREVSFATDRDVIHIGADEGTFYED
jgi:hypothetical protein